MNTLKYMALITLISGGQSIWAMQESIKSNYCHDAIEKIKNATAYDPISLLNLLGIQDNDDDIFENRNRVFFIVSQIAKSNDVDQNKKRALEEFKHEVCTKANAYRKAKRLKAVDGRDITKEDHIKRFQDGILESVKEYAYKNYLPLEACPAHAIVTKVACIEKLRAASREEVGISPLDLLANFLDIPIKGRRLGDINEEVYRKQRDIHAIIDEVRLNP